MIDSKQSSQFITHLLAHWDLETSRRHYTKKKFFINYWWHNLSKFLNLKKLIESVSNTLWSLNFKLQKKKKRNIEYFLHTIWSLIFGFIEEKCVWS